MAGAARRLLLHADVATPSRLGPLALLVLVAACAAETSGESVAEQGEALAGPRPTTVSLKYEGTCEFLRTCSTYSRGLPEGEVLWGCDGRDTCADDDLWVAGPTRRSCRKTVRLCREGRCVDAQVRDVSVSGDWEASNGVLDALGLAFGLSGRCAGWGGGRVTVQVLPGGASGG